MASARTHPRTHASARKTEMRISDWMTGGVLRTVGQHESVQDARALLERFRINQLPVVDEGGRLIGIVAERDLRAASPAVNEVAEVLQEHEGVARPERIPIETVMTRKVIVLRPDDSVEEDAWLMRGRRIAAIPIVEGGCVVGGLTRDDVIDAVLAQSTKE